MKYSKDYDTVAFDTRDNAVMLFFACTTDAGDIKDYLLLMRAVGEDYDQDLYIEVNERQFSGHDLVSETRLSENMLTLELREPAQALDGASEIVLTFDATDENKKAFEQGAFLILGDSLAGGHA